MKPYLNTEELSIKMEFLKIQLNVSFNAQMPLLFENIC
jgi:hypothetical protein